MIDGQLCGGNQFAADGWSLGLLSSIARSAPQIISKER